ncbi:MAG: TetR/AcrR family transcriptional regulator [Actinomycetota bacterium]|nr:TetR/AcrR family transcriptional regulator [Actinomycetota bacterium]
MVAAAERVFAERGYDAASMDDIAAECGVTKPMLYAYFGSKEGLFAACGIPAGERFRAQLEGVADGGDGDPAERLWRVLRMIFQRLADNRETWLLLYPPDGPPPSGPLGTRAAINSAAITELVARLLREAAVERGVTADVADAQIQPLAHALVGAAFGMARWALKHPDEHPDLQALRLMNLVWQGLGALQDGRLWLPAEWSSGRG